MAEYTLKGIGKAIGVAIVTTGLAGLLSGCQDVERTNALRHTDYSIFQSNIFEEVLSNDQPTTKPTQYSKPEKKQNKPETRKGYECVVPDDLFEGIGFW